MTKHNPYAKALFTHTGRVLVDTRPKTVRPKAGKGSYKRKNRDNSY